MIMMKKTNQTRKYSSFILCMVLIVAMALSATGCNGGGETAVSSGTEANASQSENTVLGEGSVSFPFTVVDLDGMETQFEIHTDQAIVGDALEELGLIAGEEGDYGLYVKTVNGITVDYDADGKYWAFYINGEYAATGVDSTPVTEGESYTFKVE